MNQDEKYMEALQHLWEQIENNNPPGIRRGIHPLYYTYCLAREAMGKGKEMTERLNIDEIINYCERKVVSMEDIFGEASFIAAQTKDSLLFCEYWGYKQVAAYLKELKQLREENKWIPVTVREATDEERKEMKIETMCDFPLPDDGQDVLVSSNDKVFTDTCCWDEHDTWLDGSGAWADVDAWRPLPKPYRVEESDLY